MKVSIALVFLLMCLVVCSLNAQIPGAYIHPDFNYQWALTDTLSPAFAKEGTWQEAVYTGLGKYDFFASYTSTDGNHNWQFYGFKWNGSGYDVAWTYEQTGMSGSLEANERMIVVGDWNGDGKKELILGVDPEDGALPNLLVFEPDGLGNLPSTPTASLITSKAPRYFNTTPPVTQQRFSWSSPPAYVRDIDKDGKPEFVGFSYEGIVVGKYSGAWSSPNAVDEVVWTLVDSMLSVGSTLADLDGDGFVELVNASPIGFGPQPVDLPGTIHRTDYFAITKPTGPNAYTTLRMASPKDSARMANGYKAFPAAFQGGGFRSVVAYDIDHDGKDEVFVADWGSWKFWMIKLGNKAVADIDSTDFYPLTDNQTLFGTPPPNPLFASCLQVADMNGNGKPEFYSGLGPWIDHGAQSVVRVEYLGGDPKSAASWHHEIVYQDTVHTLVPRQVLAAGDITGNGKQELVIINANAAGGGGAVIVLESKTFGTTGVDEANGTVPEKFSISQNYPNPFNPSTVIRYTLPKQTDVKLNVYNVLGQKVAELVNTVQPAGEYEVTLHANRLASGVYFYRMQAGPFVEVRKMLLMK